MEIEKSISDMSNDELLEVIKGVRSRRREVYKAERKGEGTKKKKKKKKSKSQLSIEEQIALLESLKKGE